MGVSAQVNMIAVVGRGGAIGPLDGLPHIRDPHEAVSFERWFLDATRGGIIVLGGRSFQMMRQRGFQGLSSDWTVAVWTRTGHLTSDKFIEALKERGKPIFIAGGAETFRTFNPYVTQYFIRKVDLAGPLDVYLPELFGKTN